MKKTYLKFWGTRGSCSVSGKEYEEFGGNSSCLEIRYGDTLAIIDAGTGIRPLGLQLLEENISQVDLFLSHTHWDHLIGFPFFELLYETGTHMTIWTPPTTRRTYRELFSDLLAPEFFPVRFENVQTHLEFRTIQQKTPLQLGDLTLDFHSTNHPGLTYGFKIQTPRTTFGYITDNELLQGHHEGLENIPEELISMHASLVEFLKGSHFLIHEAQYTKEEYKKKENWGHSSVDNALYLLRETRISKWLVTHHDPAHNDKQLRDMEKSTNALLNQHQIGCKASWIPDGYTIQLE